MKNVKKGKQILYLQSVWDYYNLNPEIKEDVNGNYYWPLTIIGCQVFGSICLKLEKNPEPNKPFFVNIKLEDFKDEIIYETKILYDSNKIIKEIDKALNILIDKYDIEEYYITEL